MNIHGLGAGEIVLAAAGADALLLGTTAIASVGLTVASCLIGIGLREMVDTCARSTYLAAVLLLKIGKMASLVMDVHDGLVTLVVEGA